MLYDPRVPFWLELIALAAGDVVVGFNVDVRRNLASGLGVAIRPPENMPSTSGAIAAPPAAP